MRYILFSLAAVATAVLVSSAGTGMAQSLPAGTIKKGTLANQKLIQDAMLGVTGKSATLGCTRIDSYEQYVVALPSGTPGSRVWQERWIVNCGGKTHPVDIVFSEAGMNAANYSIK